MPKLNALYHSAISLNSGASKTNFCIFREIPGVTLNVCYDQNQRRKTYLAYRAKIPVGYHGFLASWVCRNCSRWCKLCPRFKVGILAGMSVVMLPGMLVDMLPVMLPDIPLDILEVRLFGMLAVKSIGKSMPVAKYK